MALQSASWPLAVQHRAKFPSERVKGVDFHPSEPWVASSLASGKVVISDLAAKTCLREIQVSPSGQQVRAVRFIASKQWVVAATHTNIRVFDITTGQRVKSLDNAHHDFIRCLAPHPSGKSLVLSCCDRGRVKLWDWERDWAKVLTFKGHTGHVFRVQWHPTDANVFASASHDHTIRLWNAVTGDCLATLQGHAGPVNCLDFFPGGDKVVSCSDDATVRVWDIGTKQCIKVLPHLPSKAFCLCFHPQLPLILCGSESGHLRIWDASTFELKSTTSNLGQLWTLQFAPPSLIPSLKYLPLALGTETGTVLMSAERGLDAATEAQAAAQNVCTHLRGNCSTPTSCTQSHADLTAPISSSPGFSQQPSSPAGRPPLTLTVRGVPSGLTHEVVPWVEMLMQVGMRGASAASRVHATAQGDIVVSLPRSSDNRAAVQTVAQALQTNTVRVGGKRLRLMADVRDPTAPAVAIPPGGDLQSVAEQLARSLDLQDTGAKAGGDGLLIEFILDESGSMNPTRDATIKAFNNYLEGQKGGKTEAEMDKCLVSLTKFDAPKISQVYKQRDIQTVPRLDHATYQPHGGTNLLDAIGITVQQTDAYLRSKAPDSDPDVATKRPAVLVVVLTDGQENQSRYFQRQQIQKLVSDREAGGWTFVFLGANIDAWGEAQSLGIRQQNAYNFSVHNPEDLMGRMATNTREHRRRVYDARQEGRTYIQSAAPDDAFFTEADRTYEATTMTGRR